VRVPHRLAAIMEGESLFNDGTALVLVAVTSHIVVSGEADAAETVRELGLAIVGGLFVGAVFGALGYWVLRSTPDHLTAILASAVLVFATSLLAERVHASAVMAVVVVGLIVGRAAQRVMEPSRVLALHGFWETTGFALNVLVFLLIGMQIRADTLMAEAGSIAIALVALHAGRAIAVYGCFAVLRASTREVVPLRWQHVIVIGNIKGALSMAAALALPQALPDRERIITIVFGVTFVTLITQALPFRAILGMLKVTLGQKDEAMDQAKGTLITARRGQAELDSLLVAGFLSRKAHAERRAQFQRLVIDAEELLRARGAAGEDFMVDSALLTAQKAALLDASRRGLVTEETAASQISAIDRELVKLTHGES
jgi:CPA1 family monovalent cation:H+ antiporter